MHFFLKPITLTEKTKKIRGAPETNDDELCFYAHHKRCSPSVGDKMATYILLSGQLHHRITNEYN